MRLEDVPSASAIDSAANTQASLLIPPGIKEVPVPEPIATAISAGSDAELVDPPLRPGTVWRVRYRENGFDAENADGDTCSGWGAYGDTGLRAGQSVNLACSDGRMASLVIGSGEGQVRPGTVSFGQTKESAVIQEN